MDNLQEIHGLAFWVLLIIVSFIQNLFFTAVSRSRQSADLKLHAVVATGSNFVWFFCNYFLLFPMIWKTMMEQNIWLQVLVGVVYTAATVSGSVLMMHFMLKNAKGKSKVGAESYKLKEADIIAIASLTGKRYLRSSIVECLEKNNGNYQDTLRALLGGK